MPNCRSVGSINTTVVQFCGTSDAASGGVLEVSQENTCVGLSLLMKFRAKGFTWDIFKNTYFEENLLLVVLQKTNSSNIFKLGVEIVRSHFCEVIFLIREVPFFVT